MAKSWYQLFLYHVGACKLTVLETVSVKRQNVDPVGP